MVSRKNWNDFRKSGLLWFINSILHMFGWAIVYEINENGCITDIYPARVKFRGYTEDANTNGYKRVTEYLKDNIDELMKEANDEI